jgi:tetratricopeptide (TPR) repeat protein
VRWLLPFAVLLVAGAALLSLVTKNRRQSRFELLASARRCLARQRYEDAEVLAARLLEQTPDSLPALLVSARAAVGLQNDELALLYLRRVSDSTEPEAAEALALGGQIALRLGFARESEQFLRRALARDPSVADANSQLAYLLGLEGRAWESFDFLMAAILQGQATTEHLLMLGAAEPVVENAELVAKCRRAVPEDPLPELGVARSAITDLELSRAEPLIRTIVAAVPEIREAQAQFGRLLLLQRSEREFVAWHAALPPRLPHPEIWSIRGEWARSQREPRVAARCFWEALRLDPNHRVANYQLGQVLQELGLADKATPFHTRATQLEKLALLVDRIYANPHVPDLMLDAARITESLGRLIEAWGWSRGAFVLMPEHPQARELAYRLQRRLHPDLPRTLPDADPSRGIDLSDWPLPAWQVASHAPEPSVHAQRRQIRIHFDDLAAAVGLNFTYFNGHDSKLVGTRMLESIGGGVAAIDFDIDGWPDVYFTQGAHWPPESAPAVHRDSMYRNLGNGRFVDTTAAAGLGDPDFSQGCTVGDFDNDGFPDLYVANIGRNRLYHNQGDGTFLDVTAPSGVAAASDELWTTSCLMADLNGDGLADLYDVSYLSFRDAPRTMCARGDEARSCGPGAFAAEQDQVYLNLGDGRFANVTSDSGVVVPEGKGLGIVAADFHGTGRLNLYIANDAVPSFYFVNETSAPGGPIRFSERGLISGLALSHSGLSTACMGVAAGDANGDGRVDLHVTNYADQSNILFQQDENGLFSDVAPQAGLAVPSYAPLGFGTQFLDGELDGLPDLVVANGHVFDLSYNGKPYQMRPQYYRNLGNARFEELPAHQLGPHFSGKYLGRGLARVDWNRDGLEDFVVSQINSPAALVTNRTAEHGHYLAVRLVGVSGSRDAVGATVAVRSGEHTWTRQLTAGDGFHACNERKLIFGLGPAVQVDEMTIRWNSGHRESFRNLPADSEILLIEGRPEPTMLSRSQTIRALDRAG